MIRKVTTLCAASLVLTGCFQVNTAQVPVATTYAYSEQQKMQAAHHWDVLAAHQAEQMLASDRLAGRTLYVAGAEGGGAFNQAFNALLTSQLVSRNAHVSLTAANALSVTYQVQLVEHNDRGYTRAPQGAWTALAAGIAVATIPYNQWSEPSLALIPAAGIVDLFSGSWTSKSDQEVVITTQVSDNQRILYSSSNIYYVNGGDSGHYRGPAPALPPAKTMSVTDSW